MLIDDAPELVTNTTGGTSTGNANAGSGSGSSSSTDGEAVKPATGADKAGAGILTALVLSGVLGGIGFMIMG